MPNEDDVRKAQEDMLTLRDVFPATAFDGTPTSWERQVKEIARSLLGDSSEEFNRSQWAKLLNLLGLGVDQGVRDEEVTTIRDPKASAA